MLGSSSSGKKNVGLAFSYVAGDEEKLADASRVLKNTSPRGGNLAKSYDKTEKNTKQSNVDYVESAYLKDKDEVFSYGMCPCVLYHIWKRKLTFVS